MLDLFEEKRDRRVLSQHYLKLIDKNVVYIGENTHPKWLDKKMPEIIKTLRSKSFFKRFELPRICEMLEIMDI